jgi:hypothetical protein
VQFQGEKLYFPGGGTYPGGADKYIEDIAALIPLNDGSIRTAIDTGCGVSIWFVQQMCFFSSLSTSLKAQ